MKKQLDPDEWAIQTAKIVAEGMLENLWEHEKKVGTEAIIAHGVNLISFYMSGILTLALSIEHPDALTDKDQYDLVTTYFGIVKGEMQNAISNAFGSAMGQFTGKDIEYYCQIKPVGKGANKLLC